MENLSQLQFEKLNAMMQIATERATQSFCAFISDATPSEKLIVETLKTDALDLSSLHFENEIFGVVAQEITGSLNAQVMLIFSRDSVLQIVNTMMGEAFDLESLAEVESDVMGELGNIMMNACVSSIADKLQALIESALPHYRVLNAQEIVSEIQNQPSSDYVLASHFQLNFTQQTVDGKLFLLINQATLDSITS